MTSEQRLPGPSLAPASTSLRRPPSLEPRPRDGLLVAALATAVALPFVVATIRALVRGWLAVGDNGNFLIRSRDVLTSHHPLLGTWSSASIPIGEDVNHPGPLLFDVLALPAKVGDSGGLAVGVLLLHVGVIALVAWFGWRGGGLRLAAAGLAATAALAWSMGSELLYDPWNPHVVLLPFLLLLVLTVAMVRGDALALPVAVAVASLIVQTHLSYALLAPPIAGWGVAWLALRHQRRAVPAVVAGVIVGLLCWAQPIADQVGGEGNLGALVGGIGQDQEAVGGSLGSRIVADVLASPPFWLRDSFGQSLRVPPGQPPLIGARPNVGGLPTASSAVAGLLVCAAVVGAAWWRARRDEDDARAAVGVAAVALVIALVVTVRLPVGGVGVPPHQVRFLWPVAVFATVVVALAVLPRRWGTRVLGAVAVGLAALSLPTHAVPAGPQDDRDAIPVVRAIGEQLDSLTDEGTLLYDTSGLRFAEPWTSAILALLQEHHIDFRVDDAVWERQLGRDRADDGDADARLFVREGEAASDVPDGVRRVAFVDGLTEAERRELRVLERDLVDLPIELDADGRAARAVGSLPSFAGEAPSAEQLLAFGELAALVEEGLLVVPDERADEVDRYAELRRRSDRLTVGLFVAPIVERG